MKTAQKFWNLATPEEGAEDSPASLLLYGELASETWWGDEVTPQAFADDLNSLGGRDLEVHINSPGGDVFAGQAIYTQLKNYAGDVHVVIDGMCASAATIVAMAGNKVSMPSNAIFMIHNPAVGVMDYYLDEPAVDKLKNALKAIKQTIVNVYRTKCSSLSDQQLKNMMDKESWLTADDALAAGFVDEVIDPMDASNAVFVNCVSFAKERYANYGKEVNMAEFDEKSFFDKLKNFFGENQDSDAKIAGAVNAERKRVTDLLAMNNGNATVAEIVNKAIADGQQADEIKPLVDKALQDAPTASNPQPVADLPEPATNEAANAMANVIQDQLESGASNVIVAPAENTPAAQADESANKNFNDVVKAMMALQKK